MCWLLSDQFLRPHTFLFPSVVSDLMFVVQTSMDLARSWQNAWLLNVSFRNTDICSWRCTIQQYSHTSTTLEVRRLHEFVSALLTLRHCFSILQKLWASCFHPLARDLDALENKYIQSSRKNKKHHISFSTHSPSFIHYHTLVVSHSLTLLSIVNLFHFHHEDLHDPSRLDGPRPHC